MYDTSTKEIKWKYVLDHEGFSSWFLRFLLQRKLMSALFTHYAHYVYFTLFILTVINNSNNNSGDEINKINQ